MPAATTSANRPAPCHRRRAHRQVIAADGALTGGHGACSAGPARSTVTPMLHIRLLGPLEVADDQGRDVLPPGAREQLCLAVLAVVAPTGLSTPRLAAELYSDRETADPRNAVQAVVSRLRRALGQSAGCVETTSNGYRLADVSLDVDVAEELLRRAAAEPDPEAARITLAEAEALWRGTTLDGLGPAAALDAERLRIDGLRADATEAVAARTLDSGATPELVATLEAATRAEPLRERRWELLMTALYRQGRQSEALRAFQQARRHLSGELGLSPGPALVELERRILVQDPALLEPAGGAHTPGDRPAGGVQSLVLGGPGEPLVLAEPAAALAAALSIAREHGTPVAVHTGLLRTNTVATLARRLLDVAHDGQVLASAATVDLARPDLAPGTELRDLGLHWLADATEPVAVWQVSGPGLRAVFPRCAPPGRSHSPASGHPCSAGTPWSPKSSTWWGGTRWCRWWVRAASARRRWPWPRRGPWPAAGR